jgi:hypothetical protein
MVCKLWECPGPVRPMQFSLLTRQWRFARLTRCSLCCWQARTQTGSLLSLSWSPDGTQLAGGGGNGAVCFAQLLDLHFEDGQVHASLDHSHNVSVVDILSETREQLDFREAVVKMSLGKAADTPTTTEQDQMKSSCWHKST